MKTINYFSKAKSAVVATALLTLFSCGSAKLDPLMKLPDVPVTYNYYDFSIQNLDEIGKCDANTLTAHYDGFNVIYSVNDKRMMTFTIENKTNKSLILDKAKTFVLYDGFSKEVFKDVRTGKVTTFGNVQDAINNVQTNESSVTLSIPPYSKWTLPINESNLQIVTIPNKVYTEVGDHPFDQYSTNATIEFIIPYTFDYALAKWSTSRNRLYIGNVHVEKEFLTFNGSRLTSYVNDGLRNNRLYHVQASSSDIAAYNKVVETNELITARNKEKIQKHEAAKVTWFGVGLGLGITALTMGVTFGILALVGLF